jgi:S1 RNA binding domain protein
MQMPKVGEVLDGKIVKILKKGAIVKLPNDNSGFLHISEISSEYIKNINEYLKVGQEIKVKVIFVKYKENKISLSIRKVDGEADKAIRFEATINKFLKESGEKLKQLQKNIESKQGVRRRPNNNNNKK